MDEWGEQQYNEANRINLDNINKHGNVEWLEGMSSCVVYNITHDKEDNVEKRIS